MSKEMTRTPSWANIYHAGFLNEPDDEHTTQVPFTGYETPTGYQTEEGVYCKPETADQWDARQWHNSLNTLI
jgi:hypothetical protein